MDFRDGLPRWTSRMDFQDGLPGWTSRMDFQDGLPGWTSRMDFQDGLPGWTSRMDFQDECMHHCVKHASLIQFSSVNRHQGIHYVILQASAANWSCRYTWERQYGRHYRVNIVVPYRSLVLSLPRVQAVVTPPAVPVAEPQVVELVPRNLTDLVHGETVGTHSGPLEHQSINIVYCVDHKKTSLRDHTLTSRGWFKTRWDVSRMNEWMNDLNEWLNWYFIAIPPLEDVFRTTSSGIR